jgi:hypothetical protein|tara:strand:+ start:309 stop:686 length:378 start_codon:yes stop_codon:yes gene_type:complete
MSHFTTIKTKFKCKNTLLKSLQVLGHETEEDVLLVNPQGHDHKQWNVCVALNDEVGFKWTGEEYELVAELDAWDFDVPVQRFIDKLTQQYAEEKIRATIKEQGFVVEERNNTTDGTVELVVGRWN